MELMVPMALTEQKEIKETPEIQVRKDHRGLRDPQVQTELMARLDHRGRQGLTEQKEIKGILVIRLPTSPRLLCKIPLPALLHTRMK
jgi:hypothetical protein